MIYVDQQGRSQEIIKTHLERAAACVLRVVGGTQLLIPDTPIAVAPGIFRIRTEIIKDFLQIDQTTRGCSTGNPSAGLKVEQTTLNRLEESLVAYATVTIIIMFLTRLAWFWFRQGGVCVVFLAKKVV